MKLVKLIDFQKLSGLSDSMIVGLLTRNVIPCHLDEKHGIMVEVESVELKEIVAAIAAKQDGLLTQQQTLVAERLGRMVNSQLERIFDQAIARFLAER